MADALPQNLDEMYEYDALRNFARSLGFHAQVHMNFDRLRAAPGREDACWYLQRSKKQNPIAAPHEPTILKFAKAEEIYAWLQTYREQTQEKSA